MHPLVRILQRTGIGHIPAVVLVVTLATTLTLALGWLIAIQVHSLVGELPKYTQNITAKVKAIKEMVSGSGQLEQMLKEVGGELKAEEAAKPASGLPPVKEPTPVVVQPESPPWIAALPAYLGPFSHLLGGGGLAVALVVFILLALEDLRNRILRLMHRGRLSSSTKAIDEASQRISRYLVMQAMINASFGILVGVGLSLIGLDYAVLWGFMAAVLRYIPYVGSWLAALFPIAASLAMFEGWWELIAITILFLVLDLAINNLIEPFLYGHSIGVSAVALLISAAIWAFLWGPIGLVLSAPITVVLAVLGKYVPQLKFLDVLLGDHPALDPDMVYYQRLMAHDEHEAKQLVRAQVKSAAPEMVYDEVLLPALSHAKRDHDRDALTAEEFGFVLDGSRKVLDDLTKTRPAPPPTSDEDVQRVRLLCCPAADDADELALHMLAQALDPTKWDVSVLSSELLTAERLAAVGEDEATAVCILALPPGGQGQASSFCKRLRERRPDIRIFVGRWGVKTDAALDRERLLAAGADEVAMTLLDTRDQLLAWRPVIEQQDLVASHLHS